MLSVKQRQTNLYYCHYYYTGKIDGVEGAGTKSAYGKLQKAHSLEVDKIYGPDTDAACIADAKELQRLLNACGAKLTVDGLVGSATIAAIKAFQKANGLTVDGIAGAATFKKLNAKAKKADKKLTWADIKHFKRSEFKCTCRGKYCKGYPVEPDLKMVKLLDDMREYFGVPITVTSGVRCKKYNNSLVGSIPNSQHTKGKAADIIVPGVPLAKVKAKAYDLGAAYSYYGTANMGNAVHVNI